MIEKVKLLALVVLVLEVTSCTTVLTFNQTINLNYEKKNEIQKERFQKENEKKKVLSSIARWNKIVAYASTKEPSLWVCIQFSNAL